jgi:hypothetical protein
MKFVDGLAKFRTDLRIFFGCEEPVFIFSEVITIETGLKSKGMCYHELFPSNNTACTQFIRLNFESAISIVKEMSLFRKYPRKKSHYSPAEETTVSSCVAAIEKTIFLL